MFNRNYEPLNLVEVSAENLVYNYKYLLSLNRNIKIAPVLKSNAYGHGITLVAKVLDELNPPFFCVDSLYEAYELQKAKIRTPILIMGYVDPKSLQTKKLPFSFAVFSKEQVDVINRFQPQSPIHVFVDTGMHREGVLLDELPEFLKYIKTKTKLKVDGLMSHLAQSENPKNPDTKNQIENFYKAQQISKKEGFKPRFIHVANSSGILNNKSYQGKLGNIARAGIASYGIDPEGKNDNLRSALTFKTHVAQVKTVKKGERIGYDFTYTLKKDTKIAILPLGYNDGVDRRLSSRGFVKIGQKFCPIIGRVSMNITTIDVSDIESAEIGDEVVVYSSNPSDKNSIQNVAIICGTIPYEMLIHLTSSTKRLLTNG